MRRTASLADLGCSIGLPGMMAAARYNRIKTINWDISWPKISAADERRKAFGLTNAEFAQADFLSDTFEVPPEVTDVILYDPVDFESRTEFFAKLQRELRPTTQVAIVEGDGSFLGYVERSQRHWLDRTVPFGKVSRPPPFAVYVVR